MYRAAYYESEEAWWVSVPAIGQGSPTSWHPGVPRLRILSLVSMEQSSRPFRSAVPPWP
jgi:hypothetical protein